MWKEALWKEALWLSSRYFPLNRLNERREATESFGQGSRFLVRDSNLDPSKIRNNNNGTFCEMEANLYGEISCYNDFCKKKPIRAVEAFVRLGCCLA
jgi:hypothetical protein